jgi:mono/diheme cytochrome c family protein
MKTRSAASQFTVLAARSVACLLAFITPAVLAQERTPRHDDPVAAVLARVPQKARARPNPFEGDPTAAAAGKKLFEQHCAECHGERADGGRRGPSLRADGVRQAMPGEIFWTVTNGVVRRGMPAWSKLPEPQRWQIITFLGQVGGQTETGNGSSGSVKVTPGRD